MSDGVLRWPVAGAVSAEAVFRALHGDATDVFWLDGGPTTTSYVGAGERWEPEAPVFEALRREVGATPRRNLALVGWLGYELLAETVGADAPLDVRRRSPYRDAAFLRVSRAVEVTADGRATLLALGVRWEGDLERWRADTLALLAQVGDGVRGDEGGGGPSAATDATGGSSSVAAGGGAAGGADAARGAEAAGRGETVGAAEVADEAGGAGAKAGDAAGASAGAGASPVGGDAASGMVAARGADAAGGVETAGGAGAEAGDAARAAAGVGAAANASARGAGARAGATWRDSDTGYLAKVAACQAAIRAGDAYVLNLTTEATVEGEFDPVEVHGRLRLASPSEHGALVRIGGVSLVSSSPEVFLEVEADGVVRTSPVKGTRGRRPDAAADARVADELAADPKERAENTMIVDLMRNDLARVCVPGSVHVTRMLAVETNAQVHQLVSTIEGRLRPGMGAVEAVEATFPAGSMTGTPKRSAIEILDRLEARPRGPYAGAFGQFGFGGRTVLAMTIRTIVINTDTDTHTHTGGSRATIGVGGGITALSDPQAELAETKLKAAALLGALATAPSLAPEDNDSRPPSTFRRG